MKNKNGFFDDWFLHKNRPGLGQQRAVKEWLKQNSNIILTQYKKFYWAGNSFIVNLK